MSGGEKLNDLACPGYAALSYTWGPESPKYTIDINGDAFQIRKNLWQLLCQLRRSKQDMYIWMDALLQQSGVEFREERLSQQHASHIQQSHKSHRLAK
jgi:Heterokaryon incompatibility protein (HET)